MTLLWCDGFDHYGEDETKMTEGAYEQVDAVFSLSSTNPRTGRFCIRRDSTSSLSELSKELDSDRSGLGAGLSFYLDSLPDSDGSYALLSFANSSEEDQITLSFTPTGMVLVLLGGFDGSQIGSSQGQIIFPETYTHVEFAAIAGAPSENEIIVFTEKFNSGNLNSYEFSEEASTGGSIDDFSIQSDDFGSCIQIESASLSTHPAIFRNILSSGQIFISKIEFKFKLVTQGDDDNGSIVFRDNNIDPVIIFSVSRDSTVDALQRPSIKLIDESGSPGNPIGSTSVDADEWYQAIITNNTTSINITISKISDGSFFGELDIAVPNLSNISKLFFENDEFSGVSGVSRFDDIFIYSKAIDGSGLFEVRVNGVTVISESNKATALAEGESYRYVKLRSGSALTHNVVTDIDDYFIWDTSGSWNNHFIGDRRCYLLKPNQDTNIADFDPSSGSFGYKMIDDESPDDDSSYIIAEAYLQSGSPLTGTSEFEVEDLPNGTSLISGINVVTRASKTDSTSAEIFTSINSGANSLSQSAHILDTTYGYFSDIYEYNPASIANFTRSSFNDVSVSITANDLDSGEIIGSPDGEIVSPAIGFSQILPEPSLAYPTATDGNSYSLDIPLGSTSYVVVSDDPALNPTSSIDIEWRGVINGTATAPQIIVEKPFTSHVAPFYQYLLAYRTDTKLVRFDLAIGGTRQSITASSIPEIVTGVRLTIDGYYDGSEMGIRVNGRTVVTSAQTGTINSYATSLHFGRHGNVTTETADANYDEVRLWSTKRTDKEIILNMDRQLSGTETNLSGLWLFNEGTGTTVADSTSNGNNGTINGATTWDATTFTWDGTTDEKWHYPARLVVPTYDGSGQLVHPSVVYLSTALSGYNWWMGFTPYPSGDDQFENPSIVASNDGINWEVPMGVTNPLVASPGGASDFNSDVNLIAVDNSGTTELWIYFREVLSGVERIKRFTSTDGISWSSPATVITTSATNQALSPWVFHDGSQFVMLVVDVDAAHAVKRRTSSDGVTWSAPSTVTVSGIPVGRVAWHIDGTIDPVSGRLHIMFDSSTGAGGANARLHYAYSDDNASTITVVDFATTGLYTDISLEYKASIVIDPVNKDRYWIYSGDQQSTGEWWPYLMMRRVQSGDSYQEKALP